MIDHERILQGFIRESPRGQESGFSVFFRSASSTRWRKFAFSTTPINALAIGVEQFEVVVESLVRLKEVTDDFNKVDEDPSGAVVGIRAIRMLTSRLAEVFHLLRNRSHLPLACARTDDDIVTHLATATHIKHDHITAIAISNGASDVDRELARRFWISGAA
jgi:hypothetical protein